MKFLALLGLVGVIWFGKAYSSINPDNLYPNAATFNRPFIDASLDQKYQLKMISDKFASVYTDTGRPVAVFDLSLNHLSLGKILLGAFTVKDFSLKGVIKKSRCAKKARKLSRKFDNDKDVKPIDMKKCEVGKLSKRSFNMWENLKMNSDWAGREGKLNKGNDEKGYDFSHSTFSFNELHLDSQELKKVVHAPFKVLAENLYPEGDWSKEENIKEFMAEFEMHYVKEKKSYKMVWNRTKRKKEKKPKLPGVVANYVFPAGNVIYRNNLMQIDQMADMFKYRWYPYGPLVATLIYRVVDKLIDRVNYHESQFVALLEAAERFEYNMKMPADLTDLTLDLVYLSRSRPQHYRSGAEYRKRYRAYQEQAQAKVMKRLRSRENINTKLIGGGQFAVAYHKGGERDGEFKGIYAAGIKPNILTKQISMHVNAKTPAFKIAERFTTDLAGYLAKAFLKTWWGFRYKNFSMVIQLPRDTWEKLIRIRSIREVALEGQLVALVEEAMAGRYNLGLSKEELQLTRDRLRSTYLNPYEVHGDKEKEVIAKNLKLLKAALAGENSEELFSKKKLVPFTL